MPPEGWAELLDSAVRTPAGWASTIPGRENLQRMRSILRLLPLQPSITLIFDDLDAPGAELEGFAGQAYEGADLVRTSNDGGNVSNSLAERFNHALRSVTADFVAFCDPGVVLAPAALGEVVLALNGVPDASVVYGDYDSLDGSGRRTRPCSCPTGRRKRSSSLLYGPSAVLSP